MSFVEEEMVVMAEGGVRYPVASLDGAAGSALDALASVWAGIERGAPKALHWGLEHAVTLGVLAATATVVMSAVRWYLTKRALARRVRYAMLPTETFDPSPEEIVRFTSQLSRARRSVGSFGPRRTDSVRLHLVSAPGGRMLQLIEGPVRAESVLRIGGFAEVELRPLDSLDVESLDALQLTASPVDDEGQEVDERQGGDRDLGTTAGLDDDGQLLVGSADVDVEGWGN